MSLSAGTKLGPYEIVGQIGAGGMGEVYRARDTRLGRDVAVKVMPQEFAANTERLKRFEREARATAALDHPNILAVFDIGTHEGTPYLVEQLLEGDSLRARLADGGLPLREALEIGAQIAKGLAAAHTRNIIHRDLKPENVFITTDGVVKILDFGLAKLADPVLDTKAETLTSAPPSTTEAGHVLGTVAYMAPEQARGLKVDQRADMFALGVVLYEMLAGERPFRGQTHTDVIAAILKEEPPPLPKSLPPGLEAIVFRCLEKRPEDRLSSAHDLALALEALSPSSAPRRAADPATTSQQRAEHERVRILHLPRRRTVVVGVSLSLAVLAVAGAWVVRRWRQVAWARNVALPELMRLVDARDYWPAFLLARRIDATVPGEPMVQKLRPQFAGEFRRKVLPVGAKVLARSRTGGDADWVELGQAGEKPLPVPLGYSAFKVQHPGLEARESAMTVTSFGWDTLGFSPAIVLARRDEVPDGMVRMEVPSEPMRLFPEVGGLVFAPEVRIGSFFVDIYEVTNREYKRFVDAGGYQRRDYWKEPFERDGKRLTWDEAMALFRDTTGRPGPATWELSTFPKGKDDFPVTGVSWYEAAAYAEFAGKRLPSVYHWALAGAHKFGSDFLPGSNFGGPLAPVGSYRGSLNIWGLYDVAGNAREWCRNASGRERFALGGASDGGAYMFWNVGSTFPPFDRNPTTGFRCVKPVAPDPQDERLDAAIARKAPVDWEKEKGFSEDVWKTWQGLLSYAKGPLDARTEWTDDTLPTWRMEKVSFAAAYGNERMVAYLFLPDPKKFPPPWQVVVYWTAGFAYTLDSSQDGRNTQDIRYWDYLVKDGRAVVYPILKGTFERGGGANQMEPTAAADCIWGAKDIFRTIDYLETRSDIRKDRIGYLGFSAGAWYFPLVCAVEPRIKTAALLGGGLEDREWLGFARRCSTPTLMINGRYDGFGDAYSPLFNALGTPADRKRQELFDADHSIAGFEKDIIRLNLEWFDRFLGPVRGP